MATQHGPEPVVPDDPTTTGVPHDSPAGVPRDPVGPAATAVGPEDVTAAAERIAPWVSRTPVFTSRRMDAELGCQVFLKAENLQRTGAFKFRGAVNALLQLDAEQRRRGVIAFSSGNHAQAMACAAGLLEIPATIMMPQDSPAVKRSATAGYGAEVITFDRWTQDREQLAAELATERGLTLIPPYDHPHIIAGQGTAALELHHEIEGLDVVIAPLGGGGLLAGTVLGTRAVTPGCRLLGAEPEAGDDGRRSLQQGSIVHIDTPRTIADGAQTQHLGRHTFPILQDGVSDVVLVGDDELVQAMRVLAGTCKLVVEPTGALALAALRQVAPSLAGQRVGVILSGGNLDLARYAELIGGTPTG